MRKFIIMGIQGSGKGTQAKLLAEDLDLEHVSVGDIFRWNVQHHTKLGAQVKRIMASGHLVDDDLVESVLRLWNILLVVGIDAAGMSVAFPVGVGLALVIGTVESYVETPKGDPGLLFTGVALIVFAMIMSALAHKRLPSSGVRNPLRGVIYSAIAGALMGFFYPQLMRSTSANRSEK